MDRNGNQPHAPLYHGRGGSVAHSFGARIYVVEARVKGLGRKAMEAITPHGLSGRGLGIFPLLGSGKNGLGTGSLFCGPSDFSRSRTNYPALKALAGCLSTKGFGRNRPFADNKSDGSSAFLHIGNVEMPEIDLLEEWAEVEIAECLDQLPLDLRQLALRLPVICAANPAELDEAADPELLGLFTGAGYDCDLDDGSLPAQIILFLENLWFFADEQEHVFRREVRITYLHELGHFFGWDEADLAERGLD